ncbi:hypothetical protein Clacol_005793 [Clathrus columnatus]|uniref:Mitochondrial chaperone BCS1 n=1 Tax=Clathrus columnatus TaxID=1419009 RepID=A0AAV5AFU7_9AGAM|nr:hypothetical protein Clacol_005793 [Clathrus columnatus]
MVPFSSFDGEITGWKLHVPNMERYSSTPSRWSEARVKKRRPLESLLLGEGMIEALLRDAQEFLDSESWYQAAGIPYRRGYLLYGPPGTGKMYTLAGELGLEIFSFSLASHGWDDSALAGVVSQIPPKAILLIEDIDCAFPSREEEERAKKDPFNEGLKSSVTLSGVLNVLDGVGSVRYKEEGRLFIATTNYIEKLDPALIRPGRIDRKLQYKYTNKRQIRALFMRFFHTLANLEADQKLDISTLADVFTDSIPEETFSVAEIQGFLLLWKTDPSSAVKKIKPWVEEELFQRKAEEERKKKREREERKLAQSQRDNCYEGLVTQPIIPPLSDSQTREGRHMTPEQIKGSEDSHSVSGAVPEIQMEPTDGPLQVNGSHKP